MNIPDASNGELQAVVLAASSLEKKCHNPCQWEAGHPAAAEAPTGYQLHQHR